MIGDGIESFVKVSLMGVNDVTKGLDEIIKKAKNVKNITIKADVDVGLDEKALKSKIEAALNESQGYLDSNRVALNKYIHELDMLYNMIQDVDGTIVTYQISESVKKAVDDMKLLAEAVDILDGKFSTMSNNAEFHVILHSKDFFQMFNLAISNLDILSSRIGEIIGNLSLDLSKVKKNIEAIAKYAQSKSVRKLISEESVDTKGVSEGVAEGVEKAAEEAAKPAKEAGKKIAKEITKGIEEGINESDITAAPEIELDLSSLTKSIKRGLVEAKVPLEAGLGKLLGSPGFSQQLVDKRVTRAMQTLEGGLSVSETPRSVLDSLVPKDMQEKTKEIYHMTAAIQGIIDKIGAAVSEGETPVMFQHEIERIQQYYHELVLLRQEFANTALAYNAMNLGEDNLSAITAISSATLTQKTQIEEILGLMGQGSNILSREEALRNSILAIIKEGGDAELDVLKTRRSATKALEEQLAYADRLMQQQSAVADMGDTASNLAIRKSLAEEARAMYSMSAVGAKGSAQYTEIFDKQVEAAKIYDAIKAQERFHKAVSDTVTAARVGLAPAFQDASEAIIRYAAVSGSAFSRGSKDATMVSNLLSEIRTKYESLADVGTAAALTEMQELVRVQKQLQETVGGTGKSAKQWDKIHESLAVEKERKAVIESINADLGKLLILHEAGVNSVANMKKLQDTYLSALKEGIPVEEKLAKLATDKRAALINIMEYQKRVSDEAENVLLNESQQLELRKLSIDLLKQAAALSRSYGKTARAGGETYSQGTIQARLAAEQQAMAARDRELALVGKLKSEESALTEMVRTRAAAENDILNILSRGQEIVNANKATYSTLNTVVDAYISAVKSGVDVQEAGLDMQRAEQQALNTALSEHKALEAIMQDEQASYLARNIAAKQYLDVTKQIKNIIGSKEMRAYSGQQDFTIGPQFLRDAQDKYKAFTGEDTPSKEPKLPTTLHDVANLQLTNEQIATKTAQETERLATAMMRVKEELLAGNNVLKNFAEMQSLVVQSAERGVPVNADTLAMLVDQEQVMNKIVEAARRIIETGKQSQSPGVAANAYTLGKKYVDTARNMLGSGEFESLGLGKMAEELNELRDKAGTALSGSLAASRKEAEALYANLEKVNMVTAQINKPTDKNSFEAYRSNIERMLPIITQIAKKEREIATMPQFMEGATPEEMAKQNKRVATLERIRTIMQQIRTEQDKFASYAGKLGLGDEAYRATRQSRVAAVKAAGATGDHKAYLGMLESQKKQGVLSAELAAVVEKSGIAGENAAEMLKSLKAAVAPSKEIAANLSQSEKSEERKASKSAGQDLFDISRMSWFLQLRMFWSSFTGVQQTIEQAITLTHTLNTLQAVAQTTDGQLSNINKQVIELGYELPIAYNEIAEATLAVAKAGFTAEESIDIVTRSAKLAQATGDNLKKVADIQTVVLHAWGMEASASSVIADQLFNTVAKSRADIEGLGSALGYVAGIAPNANVSLEETLAVFGMLSNAGLAMSKSGTYMRQFLNNLLNPSEKLIATLNRVGLTTEDINPRLHTLQDIFMAFRTKNVNLSDIFEGMDLRAASAFSIMVRNASAFGDFKDMVEASGSVNKAYVHTLRDFESASSFLQNELVALSDTMGNTFSPTAIFVLELMGKMLRSVKEITDEAQRSSIGGPLLQLSLNAVVAGGAVALLTRGVAGLLKVMSSLGLVAPGIVTAFGAMAGKFALIAGVAIAAGIAVGGLLKHFFGQEHAEAIRRLEEISDAITELQQHSQQQITVRMNVDSVVSAMDMIRIASKAIEDANLGVTGGRQFARSQQNQMLIAADMSNNPILKKAADEARKQGLIISPEMDEEAARAMLNEFIKLITDAATKAGLNIGIELEKGIKEGAKKAEDILTQTLAAADDATKFAKVTNIKDMALAGPVGYTSQLINSYRGVTGEIISLNRKAARASGMEDLHAIMVKLSEVTKDYGTDLSELQATVNEGDFTAAQRAVIETTDHLTLSFGKLKQVPKVNWKEESIFGWAGGSADFQNTMRSIDAVLTATEGATQNLIGDDREVERLNRYHEAIVQVIDALKEAGMEKGITDSGMYARAEELLDQLEDKIKESKALVAANREAKEDTVSGGRRTEDAQNQNIRESMAALQKRLDETSIISKSIAESGTVLNVMPSIEGFDVYTTQLEDVRNKLKGIVEEYKEIQRYNSDNSGKTTMPVEFNKAFIKNVKDYLEGVDALSRARGDMLSVSRIVANASQVQSTVDSGLSIDTILKISEAGGKALAIIRDLGNADFGTSYQEYLGRILRQWQELNTMSQHVGFAESMGKARAEVAKSYRAVVEHNKAMNKSIRLNSASIAGYNSAVVGLNTVINALNSKDISQDTLSLAKNLETAEKFTAQLTELESTVYNFVEETKNAQKFFEMFQNGQKLTKEAVDQWKALGDGIRSSMDEANKALVNTRKEIVSLSSELSKSFMEQARSAYDLKTALYEIDRSFMETGHTKHLFDMGAINSLRRFISENAENMSPVDMRAELKGLQKALLEYYKNNPYSRSGESARSEAILIQNKINELFKAERDVTVAEIELRKAYYSEVTTRLKGMSDSLNDVQAILQSTQSANANLFDMLKGQVVGGGKEAKVPPSLPQDRWALVHKYESGVAAKGNVNAIGYDKSGGTSYGSVQLSSDTMRTFVSWLEKQPEATAKALATMLKDSLTSRTGKSYEESSWNTGRRTGAGPDAWKRVAAASGEALDEWVHKFMDISHIADNYAKVLRQTGVDLAEQSTAVQAAMHSTFTQHGSYGVGIFKKALDKAGKENIETPEFLKELYSERAQRQRFSKSTDAEFAAVQNRLLKQELPDALNMMARGTQQQQVDDIIQNIGSVEAAVRSLTPDTRPKTKPDEAQPKTEEAIKKLTAAQNRQTEVKNTKGKDIGRETDADFEFLSVSQAAEAYRAKTRDNINAQTQALWNGLADSIHQGVASSVVAAMKAVGTDKSWEEAAGEALENMAWQMIEMWIQSQMSVLSQAIWSGDFSIWTQGWGFDGGRTSTQGSVTERRTEQPQSTTPMNAVTQSDAQGGAGGGGGLFEAANQIFNQNVISDAANIMQQTMLLMQEDMQVKQAQTLQTTEQTMVQQEMANIQAFGMATQQFMAAIQMFQMAIVNMPAGGGGGDGGGGGKLGGLGKVGDLLSLVSSFGGKKEGGLITHKFGRGGLNVYGSLHKDSGNYQLMKNEYVIRQEAVRKFGSAFFNKLNRGDAEAAFDELPGFDRGTGGENLVSRGLESGPAGRSPAEQPTGPQRRESLKIINVTDPRIMESFMATPKGRRYIQNVAGFGIRKITG